MENNRYYQWGDVNRHILVLSFWLPAGFIATLLIAHGYFAGSSWFVVAGFGCLVAGLTSHIIINALCKTPFTLRERALGLIIYILGLAAFLISILSGVNEAEALFLPFCFGFISIFVVAVFYMVTHYGVRGAFSAFDVIRSFRPLN